MHCAFLPLLNPNIDLLQAVKVVKSGHHLAHDRASKGYGSTPCLMSQTSLHACLQRLNTMQISLWHQTRNRPMPLTSSVVWQMMARFRNFYNIKKGKTLFKKPQCVSNRCKDSFQQRKYFGVMGTLKCYAKNTTITEWRNRAIENNDSHIPLLVTCQSTVSQQATDTLPTVSQHC